MDTIINSPPTTGDWLHFAQFATVLFLNLTLFLMCLYYSPERRGQNSAVVAIYTAFLAISIVPVIFESTLPPPGEIPEQRWFTALFFGVYSLFINPIITALGIAALFPQARETLSGPDNGALSTTWLGQSG